MKKIYYFFLFTLCMMWGSSCNDYLEFQETDLIAGDIALQTVTNNESAIMGAYAAVDNAMGILMNSVFSDEVKTAGEFYNASTTHEWKYGPADVGIRDNYTAVDPQCRVIDRVNRVLARIEIADSTSVGDNVKRKRLRGEALFLRAFAHFELYRFYAGKFDPAGLAMPYMEAPSMDPQARIQTAEYFEKLNRDINEAKTLLPANLSDINRANVVSANGLHARIALYSENWVDAETYATNYINALPLAPRADFPGIWTDANTLEVAYRIQRSNVHTRLGSLYRGTSTTTSSGLNIGQVVWTVSNKLYDSYSGTDIRQSSYFKIEPALVAANRPLNGSVPGLIINKYPGTAYTTANENIAHSKMMRTSEMYLIRAEARAEQNNLSGAASDLNALRAARILGYVDVTLATKDQAIDEIMTERWKELAFEGHRFWDLKRRGMAVERLTVDAPSSDAVTLPANDFKFALPIPEVEIQANPAMQQNTGYF